MVPTSNFNRTMWLLQACAASCVHVFDFEFQQNHAIACKYIWVQLELQASWTKKISDGSHPYPCPPELEARKNLLVHEWKHLKRSTETHRYIVVFHTQRKMANLWSLIDLSLAVNRTRWESKHQTGVLNLQRNLVPTGSQPLPQPLICNFLRGQACLCLVYWKPSFCYSVGPWTWTSSPAGPEQPWRWIDDTPLPSRLYKSQLL